MCDQWWKPETEWHREWKRHFPEGWQEVVHYAESGEKHIADVKTDRGWVIEFQHSYLNPEERRSRNAFYAKLVWVVDGTRRKRDSDQFRNALNRATPIGSNARLRIHFANECALLREWSGSNTPMFIDFGPGPTLWWILAELPNGSVDVGAFARADLIDIFREGDTPKAREFEEFVASLPRPAPKVERQPLAHTSTRTNPGPPPVPLQIRMYPRRRRRL